MGREPTVKHLVTSVELDAIIDVLAVDSKGSETKMDCTVERCERVEGNSRTEVVPRGSIIIVAAGPRADNPRLFGTSYSLRGGKLSPETMVLFGKVIAAKLPDAPTDEEIFGTSRSRKIGDSWAIDGAKGSEFLKAMGISVEPKDLGGKSKLAGTETVAGKECLRVESTVSSQKFAVTLPPEGTLDKTSIESSFVFLVPSDGSKMRRTTVDVHVDIVAKGRNADAGEFTAHNSSDTAAWHLSRHEATGGQRGCRSRPYQPGRLSSIALITRSTVPEGSVAKLRGNMDADHNTAISIPGGVTLSNHGFG